MQIALWLIILPCYLEFHGTDRFRNLSKLGLYEVELKLQCKYGKKPHHHQQKKQPTTHNLIRYLPNALMVLLWISPVPARHCSPEIAQDR